MQNENEKALFRNLLTSETARLTEVKDKKSALIKNQEETENQLVKEYDDSVGPDLRKAIDKVLNTGYVSQILSIFDEAVETIAKQEGLKIQTTRTLFQYFIQPVGRLSSPEEVKKEDKIKIVRFLRGEDVETFFGKKHFTGDSIEDIIDGFQVGFGYGLAEDKYISEDVLFRRDGQGWGLFASFRSEDVAVPIETFAKKMAKRVANRSYIRIEEIRWSYN